MSIFYRPVSPWIITQRHGENKGCIDATGRVFACDGRNPPAGTRSIYSMMDGHQGYDIVAMRWQPCYAAREGVVIEKQTDEAAGLGITLLHGPYDGKYWKTRYWHLISMEVDIGDPVSTGQLIGYCDNTGYSSGDHLHFDIKQCDRWGNTVNKDNGYLGAINPDPLMFDIPAVEVNKLRLAIESIRATLQAIIDRMGRIQT
jgi:murein DD-endopeptidase MepM/ murein hydrolase activator NlpD